MPTSGVHPYGPPPAHLATGDKMSGLAVAAFIFGLTGCLSLFGLILGISALRQIKRNGERGRGFAIAGIVLGGICNGAAAILTIASFATGSGS